MKRKRLQAWFWTLCSALQHGLRACLRAPGLALLLWATATPAVAQISFVAASTSAGASAVNSVSVAKPAGLATSDVMLAYVATRGGGQFPTTLSAPTGWVSVLAKDDGTSISVAVFRKVATASEAASYTFTLGASDRTAAAIVAFRGVDTTSPVDVSGSQVNAASTTYTAPSVTTTGAGTMLVTFHGAVNGNGTVAAATGMTQAFSAGTAAGANGVVIGSSYATQAAAGVAGNKVSNGNTSLVNVGALVALRAAPVSPLAYWRMDDAQWNGTANEVLDSSSNGYHGRAARAGGSTALPTTASGTPAYTSGAQSTCSAGQFDTSTGTVRTFGYVELPSLPSLTSNFTVAAWVRSDDVTGSGQRILARDDANDGWALSLGDGGSGRLRLFNRKVANSGTVSGNGVNPVCGVFCLDTTAVIANGNWYFVAAVVNTTASTVTLHVFDSTGTQLATTSGAYSATWQPGTGMTAIGGETAASTEGRSAAFHFKGRIDEVQVYAAALTQTQVQGLLPNVRTCAFTAPDHYELSLPSTSLACLPSTVTITACANSSSPCTSPATTVGGATATLATSAGTLGATSVTFNSSGVATTTLSFPAASDGAAAAVTLSGESTAATNARQCCPNGSSCSVANSCNTTFNTAGFIVAGSAGGNAATVPSQTAGTASAGYFLRAVRSSTTTQACEAALSGATTVNWGAQCNNPTTCAAGNLMSINGGAATAITGNPSTGVSSYSSVAMTFDANGNAPFSFTYGDVGQVTLHASKSASGSLLSNLIGSSNAFVVKPANLVISNLKQTTAPNLANPAAASATGAKFVKAGEAFTATVTAQTSGGVATPNFGRESPAEGVLLSPTLVLPAAGATGTLSNGSIAGGSFASGAATVSTLAYSEVGIVTLNASIADGDYLGTGNVTGTTSANVGRFIPAQFALSAPSVTHRSGLTCSPASSFTHLGENFSLGFTLVAQNTLGTTTANYTGSFAKLDPTSASSWNLAGLGGTTSFSVASGRLSLGTSTGSWSNGVAKGIVLIASATRATTPDGPFDAKFGIAPTDSDGVAMSAFDMASTSVGKNDRTGLGSVALRFGRLRLSSAVGPADRTLSLPVTAQYWSGSAWDTNTLDSCTTVPTTAFNFGNLMRTITTADTAASSAITLAGGTGLLRLTAPASGRVGTYDVALSLGSTATDSSCLQTWTPAKGDEASAGANLAFLRGAWCGSTYGNDPSARATFGQQSTQQNLIYRRENY